MSPPKSCAVCGDKALGYNFNAVTCESCKAFFRRNALAKKQFACPFNQNCEMTVVTRRFCQKCRLKKCLDIGMKSENIMSEEDKLIKRRKIEDNRAKRGLSDQRDKCSDRGESSKPEQLTAAYSTGFDAYATVYDSQQSFGSIASPTPSAVEMGEPSLLSDPNLEIKPELMTGEEMVEFIVSDPDRASQAISKLFRTPAEGMAVMEKIISSQKDALKLISHLIAYPGDALKIISKIMNSPFNALTVFTKFMSSPTDALEIISKIVSSPQDVLHFIRNLMDSPEDALDIMNKFMNTPAEALKILNKIFNDLSAPSRIELDEGIDRADNCNENINSSVIESETYFQCSLKSLTQLTPSLGGDSPLIQSILSSSPSGTQTYFKSASEGAQIQSVQIGNVAYAFHTSPHALSNSSNSPSILQNDDLPSTSTGLISTSPDCVTKGVDFANENFDIRTFIKNSFPGNSGTGEGINSLESVLSEVIRIEFQAFNNLPQEHRGKQEQLLQNSLIGGCNSQRLPLHHHQQQQSSICAPSSVLPGRDLNDTEQLKLRELRLASEALYYPVDEELSLLMMNDDRIKSEDSRQDPKLLQVINLTAVAIKRLIKMAKKISAFRDMCQEDQVALLKGGCTEMMIMRSVMNYDENRSTWKIPHTQENMSNIRAEVIKLAKGNVYEELSKFICTFDEKWRLDENIILIMCAIVLFTPTRLRIVHSDVIRLEQNSYYYLLRRYLESVYPGCEAKSAFIKLIQKISDVERLNEFIIGVYLNVNPAQVEPLLREIFDLKNH